MCTFFYSFPLLNLSFSRLQLSNFSNYLRKRCRQIITLGIYLILLLILKRDDLLLDEIVIWDNLIKWCLTQHPNISQDPTQWSKEEITIIERTIHGFIPLIRFYYISSEDFAAKVYPFKKIIPNF